MAWDGARRRVLLTQAQLAFYQSSYAQLAIIFPFLVTAPRYFAGAITLGVMMQTASAFGQVQSALSFFVDNYTSLAELRAVMDRLKGLQAATEHKHPTSIEVTPQPGRSDVGSDDLTLALPNGQTLLENVKLELPPGRSTLVWGASGTGKSTLFRALAGIWPFGRGHVHVPAGARVLFLPQKTYIPIGTLRDAVKYPDDSFEAMKERAAEQSFAFDYLIDETQEVARAYGAVCTPDPFLFVREEGRFVLRYHGRIDDSWKDPAAVKRRELAEAVEAVLSGAKPSGEQVPTMGCNIKWRAGNEPTYYDPAGVK